MFYHHTRNITRRIILRHLERQILFSVFRVKLGLQWIRFNFFYLEIYDLQPGLFGLGGPSEFNTQILFFAIIKQINLNTNIRQSTHYFKITRGMDEKELNFKVNSRGKMYKEPSTQFLFYVPLIFLFDNTNQIINSIFQYFFQNIL